MQSSHDDKPGGGGLHLGAGAALLMVARCAMVPLVAAGGVIAGIGALLFHPWELGAGVAVLVRAAASCCPPTLPARGNPGGDAKDDHRH